MAVVGCDGRNDDRDLKEVEVVVVRVVAVRW